jgi:Protein of unknown function (DUF3102)
VTPTWGGRRRRWRRAISGATSPAPRCRKIISRWRKSGFAPVDIFGASEKEAFLATKADAIRRLAKTLVADAFAIGGHLIEAKARCAHGEWYPWLEREFGWCERQAHRFITLHKMAAKSDKMSDLLWQLDLSTAYTLSAKSTPPEVVEEVAGRVEAGERVSHAHVKAAIESHREQKAVPLPYVPFLPSAEAIAAHAELQAIAQRYAGAAGVSECLAGFVSTFSRRFVDPPAPGWVERVSTGNLAHDATIGTMHVAFVDGAEVTAGICRKGGKWFVGNAMGAVCDRYRYRFATTADFDLLAVPEIASAAIEGEAPYDVAMLNAKTAERRRAKPFCKYTDARLRAERKAAEAGILEAAE